MQCAHGNWITLAVDLCIIMIKTISKLLLTSVRGSRLLTYREFRSRLVFYFSLYVLGTFVTFLPFSAPSINVLIEKCFTWKGSMRRWSGILGIGTTEIMSQFFRKEVNLMTFWTLPLHLALHLDLQESFSCKNCEHFVKISLIVKKMIVLRNVTSPVRAVANCVYRELIWQ